MQNVWSDVPILNIRINLPAKVRTMTIAFFTLRVGGYALTDTMTFTGVILFILPHILLVAYTAYPRDQGSSPPPGKFE